MELQRAPLGPPASVLLDFEFWSRDGAESDGCVLPTWMQGAVLTGESFRWLESLVSNK